MVQERLIGFGTANIKVFGVGGGGGNAINRMYKDTISGIQFVAVNTDNQALENSIIPEKIRIGDRIARGMGVGGDPTRGKQSAEESRSEIKDYMSDADMVFVAAGMGGGSGTGAAPVIAEIAKSSGALTIGVVTKPFGFEGTQRLDAALQGIENIKKYVDTLIVVPNDRLLQTENNLSMSDAFSLADDVLKVGIQSIAELILVPGEINLDFADVRTIMENAGPAWMGIGESEGENRSTEAAERAVSSPLLEMPIDGAKGVESQTQKLFEVCRLRDMPIITFCNKMDRESRDLIEIIDEIQEKLAIDVTPLSWPIGSGSNFRGLYHFLQDRD